MPEWVCTNCQNANYDDFAFCPKCGHSKAIEGEAVGDEGPLIRPIDPDDPWRPNPHGQGDRWANLPRRPRGQTGSLFGKVLDWLKTNW